MLTGKLMLVIRKDNEWRNRKKMHEEKGSTRKEVIEEENDPDLYQVDSNLKRNARESVDHLKWRAVVEGFPRTIVQHRLDLCNPSRRDLS